MARRDRFPCRTPEIRSQRQEISRHDVLKHMQKHSSSEEMHQNTRTQVTYFWHDLVHLHNTHTHNTYTICVYPEKNILMLTSQGEIWFFFFPAHFTPVAVLNSRKWRRNINISTYALTLTFLLINTSHRLLFTLRTLCLDQGCPICSVAMKTCSHTGPFRMRSDAPGLGWDVVVTRVVL